MAALSLTDRHQLLTTAEVAQVLRVSPRTVRRLGATGTLQRIVVGHRTVRYTPTSVELLLTPATSSAPAGNQGAAKADAGGQRGGS